MFVSPLLEVHVDCVSGSQITNK